MKTILYFVRDGENEELRYSLRSLKYIPHDRVIIVGGKPEWVTNVDFIPGNRYADKWRNVYNNLEIACKETPGDWVVMNDDIYFLRPTITIPSWYRKTLTNHINSFANPRGAWYRSLCSTRDLLQALGIPNPISYELHIPVEMNSKKLAYALQIGRHLPDLPQWRSMYGNLWKIEAVQAPDVRVREDTGNLPRTLFASTNDVVFGRAPAGRQLRAMFPDESPYEQPGSEHR